MAEVITVKIGQHQKWQKLLLYLQNSPHTLFRMRFADEEQARGIMTRLHRCIAFRPTWFNLVICQRGADVYVIKPDKAKKVVVVDA